MNGTRVLIVDDRPDNLLALEATLEPLAVEVTQAHSGPDALRQLLSEDFAVILLDVQMPGMDGYETARLIKSRARNSNVPIIFLTAISREAEHQLRGYEAGAVDYLAKPFDPEVLRSKVAVFMALHQQARTIEAQNRLLAERLEERDRAQAALGRHAAELQRSNAELDRFASVVGYDLLEPLHLVGGLLELLDDRHRGALDDEGRLLVERARARTAGLAERVDELLVDARGSVEPLRLAPIDLGRVLDRALAELAPLLEESAATVQSDPLPEVVGDEWLLGRVFAQLLGHGVRNGSAVDPQVDVRLSRRDGDWVVSVHDNGPGIGEDGATGLFASFADGDADGSPGLAVCRRIVERHGGTIWAESVSGRGTTVSFTVPVAPEPEPRVGGVRLLLVDDDPDYCLLVSLALAGCPDVDLVGVAGTADEVGDAARRLRPDLVLVDLLLAGAGPGAVLAGLRLVAPDAAVLGTSAFADREVGPVGSGGGRVLGHLSKAVPPSRLGEEIVLLAGMVGVVRRTLDAASAHLSPEAPSARQARRFVDETLRRWDCDDLLDTVELLVSELVTNAVLHARSDVDVSVQLLPDRVRIEVADQSPEGIRRRQATAEGSSGRGISMVETLALAWGVTPNRTGKVVWFEVARPER